MEGDQLTVRVSDRASLREALEALYDHVEEIMGDDAEALNAIGQAQDMLRDAMIGDEDDDYFEEGS